MHFPRVLTLVAGGALAVACDSTDPSNAAPVAAFTVECNELECTFDNGSADGDGTIEAQSWDFGDGGTSVERSPTYAYSSPGGRFTVTLAVTDDDGAEASATREVNVSQGNGALLADFSVSCESLTCSFTDQSSGPVASRAWDFGDGKTSTEPSPVHTYAPPGGRFTVTLTVTGDDGTETTAREQLEVTPGTVPDRAGTYVRQTPHSALERHSRYLIRGDGTFELHDGRGADTTVYAGRWEFACCWGGWPLEPGAVILFDFDDFEEASVCGGDAFGSFLLDGHLAMAYCSVMIRAGFEEGVYTSAPDPDTPKLPPPAPGQIAFVRDGRIYRANTDGSGLVQLSAGPDDGDPAWSPDGSRIAFTRASGGPAGVFIMDADGSNVVRRATSAREPTWSPDGRWLAFGCVSAGGQASDICTVKADEGAAAPVHITHSQLGWVSSPAWSPDGTRIAFIADWAMYDSWFDIWIVAPDGSQLSALTTHTPAAPNPDEQYQPAWSPDGRRIAHVECPWAFDTCSSSVIEVMNADGSGSVRLAAASGFASPTWSPDGQVIAFASSNVIEWVSADGSQRGSIIRDGHSPAWRP